MNTRDFDSKLQDLRALLEDKREPMEQICNEVVSAVKTWLPKWWEQHIEKLIEQNPEYVNEELGSEGVEKLKQGLKRLTNRSDELVDDVLDSDDFWLHRTPTDDLLCFEHISLRVTAKYGHEKKSRYVGRDTKHFMELVERLAGELGPLVVERGLDTWYNDAKSFQHGPWAKSSDGLGPRYRRTIELPSDVRDPIEAYEEQAKQLVEIMQDYQQVLHEKAQAEARSLWDDS